MYARVKEVTVNKRRNCKSNAIKDKDGTLLTEPEEIQRRWQEYTETLYDKDVKPKLEDMEVEEENEVSLEAQGPSLLESEIRMAIKEMKSKKSTGIDNISAEMIKSLGEKATEELVLLCKHMYNKGEWPDDFSKSIVVPIEKKANATECGDFRTISSCFKNCSENPYKENHKKNRRIPWEKSVRFQEKAVVQEKQ